jgi:hypothetical protein
MPLRKRGALLEAAKKLFPSNGQESRSQQNRSGMRKREERVPESIDSPNIVFESRAASLYI